MGLCEPPFMKPIINHSWDISIKEAKELQVSLREKLVLKSDFLLNNVSYIAGADVSYSKISNKCYAAIVVFKYPEMDIIEKSFAIKESSFPYVPGYLSFREAPSLIEAFSQLKTEPDILIFDSQGIAHPRRFGLASHLGVLFDKPSIGCAKNRLIGEYSEPENVKNATSTLKIGSEIIGSVLKTKVNCKPIFISQGHKISLEDAIEIINKSTGKYRIPLPTREAHLLSNKIRLNDLNH